MAFRVRIVGIFACILLAAGIAGAQAPSAAKVALGSNTAKNGFKNEDDIRDKFNSVW